MLQVTKCNDCTLIRLDNGVPNALSAELLEHLDKELSQAEQRQIPLILAGNSKFFSMGLNLPEIISYDQKRFADYMARFNEIVYKLYTLPVPVVCAMEGHAVAGGAILALASDIRIGSGEQLKFGLNESLLGLPVPYLAALILGQRTSSSSADLMLYQGVLFSFKEALHRDLLHSLVDATDIIAEAALIAGKTAGGSMAAFAAMKSMRTQAVAETYRQGGKKFAEKFVECWFQEKSRSLIMEASRRF